MLMRSSEYLLTTELFQCCRKIMGVKSCKTTYRLQVTSSIIVRLARSCQKKDVHIGRVTSCGCCTNALSLNIFSHLLRPQGELEHIRHLLFYSLGEDLPHNGSHCELLQWRMKIRSTRRRTMPPPTTRTSENASLSG